MLNPEGGSGSADHGRCDPTCVLLSFVSAGIAACSLVFQVCVFAALLSRGFVFW
jgi:hypothetical protein